MPKAKRKPKPKPVYIYVKSFEDKSYAHKIEVRPSNLTERYIERVERGLLRNMDTETYYVDTDEADAAVEARKKKA